MLINIQAAWIGFFLGCVSGAIPGLLFHRSDWLGGYNSWQRRMVRLAHIAFFGIGFLNVLFYLSVKSLGLEGLQTTSILFLVGAVAMPLVCYLSAWKMIFRHLFFIPAMSVILGIVLLLWKVLAL